MIAVERVNFSMGSTMFSIPIKGYCKSVMAFCWDGTCLTMITSEGLHVWGLTRPRLLSWIFNLWGTSWYHHHDVDTFKCTLGIDNIRGEKSE